MSSKPAFIVDESSTDPDSDSDTFDGTLWITGVNSSSDSEENQTSKTGPKFQWRKRFGAKTSSKRASNKVLKSSKERSRLRKKVDHAEKKERDNARRERKKLKEVTAITAIQAIIPGCSKGFSKV